MSNFSTSAAVFRQNAGVREGAAAINAWRPASCTYYSGIEDWAGHPRGTAEAEPRAGRSNRMVLVIPHKTERQAVVVLSKTTVDFIALKLYIVKANPAGDGPRPCVPRQCTAACDSHNIKENR